MKRIDYLGNTNQGSARGKTIALRSPGVAVGFKLKNLLNVGHTRGASSMQHLCKVNYNRNKDLERNDLAQEKYIILKLSHFFFSRTLLPKHQIYWTSIRILKVLNQLQRFCVCALSAFYSLAVN